MAAPSALGHMTHSMSVLSAAGSMRSGLGRGNIARRSSSMRAVCQGMVARSIAALSTVESPQRVGTRHLHLVADACYRFRYWPALRAAPFPPRVTLGRGPAHEVSRAAPNKRASAW